MSLKFNANDIAGVQGKEIEVWVKTPTATEPNQADVTAYQIRGAQNFNTTEEEAESKVSEMGYKAQKTIYGTTNYSVSTSLLIRDLVQIARLSGLDPNSAGRVNVDEFTDINCVNYIKDPDVDTTVLATVIVSGFKARAASKALAVDANATITLDGAADLVSTVDGKAMIREHVGDGSCLCFMIAAGVAEGEVYIVEYPAGEIISLWDGYTYMAAGAAGSVGGVANVQFATAPDDGAKVRIVYKTT